MNRTRKCSRWTILAVAATLGVCALPAFTTPAFSQQLVGGRNVNMTGGSQIIQIAPFQVRGDVLGRAQNEPSCAMSTRNPQHILCGANDYRMVDVPGVTTSQIIRDAWLGEFQSVNGGETWESRLLGGFVLDPAPHPLRQAGYTAAADAVVRSGPAGVTYYAGIAFTADKSKSALHVTTYIDANHRENDEMPFKRVRTTIVASSATAARFIDKPWIYVEAAPAGRTCTMMVPTPRATPAGFTETSWERRIAAWLLRRAPGWTPEPFVMQRVPASIIHAVYAVFLDPADSTADIMYSRSDNCGRTFQRPVRLNSTQQTTFGSNEHGNGATIAKPLVTGSTRVYAAWRRARLVTASGVLPDAIMSVVSNDNGRTWTAPQVISEICPFDQGTTATSFRTTAFPTMTADATGRVYIAWSDRRGPDGVCERTPSGAPLGAARIRIATSTNGTAWTHTIAVPSPTPEHQILPTLAFTAGRLFMGWVDFAEDASGVFAQFINEADALLNQPAIRHTGDVRAAFAMPAAAPNFADSSTRISEYLKGVVTTTSGERIVGQLQWNAVNRRWARKGTVPFNGDYIDVATLSYLPPLPGQTAWRPNNQATMVTALGTVPTVPQVLFAWADNRDMRTGPDVDNPAVPVPFETPAGLDLPAQSIYDPTQVRPVCTTGADSFKTGATNQNTYSARASIGFLAASPGNNKNLGSVTRAFVVYLRNDTTAAKSFRLIAAPPAGGFASFDQFVTSLTTISVTVPRRSSIARTVYVSRNPASATLLNPEASVRVDVIEMAGDTPVQAASVILNGDTSAPEIEAPEIEAREVYAPEIEATEIEARTAGAPEIEAPEIEAPEIEAPEIEAIAWMSLGLQRPEIEAPEIEALEVEAPEIEAPEIEATAITDVRFTITNTGNTVAQYNAKAFVDPAPGSDFKYQVIVRRRYELPAVDINCEPTTIALSKVAVNLPDVTLARPEIEAPEIEAPEIEAPEIEAAGIATFYLEPGAQAEITIRARSASGQVIEADDVDIAVAPPVDSDDAALGITTPEVVTTYLTVATGALPAGRVGTPYSYDLATSGHVGGVTWMLVAGLLPSGIVLAPSGQLLGTPDVPGTFTFRVRATDGAPNTAERDLTLVITSGAATLAFVTQPSSTAVGVAISPAVSVRAFSAAGIPVANVLVMLQRVDGSGLLGTLSRTTGASGVAVFDNLALPGLASGVVLRASAGGFASTDSIAFNAGQPDLVVSSIEWTPVSPTTSDPIQFTVSVTNIGTAAAGPSVLSLAVPSVYEAEDPPELIPVPALAPGAAYNVVRSDGPLPEGGLTISATADSTGLVAELNEGNNTLSEVVDVEEGGGGPGAATIYESPAAFALATNATNATGPLPNLGSVDDGHSIGGLVFELAEGGDTLDIGKGPGDDWYPNLPGHDIALGTEALRVRFPTPVAKFGFYFAEPNATMPMWGGSPVDSEYRIELFQVGEGAVSVGEFTFNAPDDQVVFVGVQNAVPFNVAVITDLSGSDDDEYFGEFYVDYGDVVGTFIVTNNDNDGAGSLREAIEAAEAQPGKNQIVFDIDGEGRTIQLETNLPAISDGESVIIDATTQSGFSGRPTVELQQNPDSSGLRGLHLEAGSSSIRGLVFSEFDAASLIVEGTGNLIIGNWFGLSPDGDTAQGNQAQGVLVEGAAFTTIGGTPALARNVFAGNDVGVEAGVGSSATSIIGNYIGTEATGTEARPNVTGVKLWSNGGFNEVTGNLISGNSGDGVSVLASNGNFIRGNTIGLDATGEGPLPNFHGVVFVADEGSSVGNILGGLNAGEGNVIAGHASANVLVGNLNSGTVIQGNTIGASASGNVLELGAAQQFGVNITGATGTQVGGAVPEARNRIVGVQYGVQALGATGTAIEGNYIGTFDGLTPVGEDSISAGVFVEGGIGVRVGGATAAHGNVIGHTITAVEVVSGDGETTSLAVVSNNLIGVGANGVAALPNDGGIILLANGTGAIVNSAIENNTLANTLSGPIRIQGDGAYNNLVRNNTFSNNLGIGLDLAADGQNANDEGDPDDGPNHHQNFPVFSAVTPTMITGSLNSAPLTAYNVDLYFCSAGQATVPLSGFIVTTNAAGNGFFNIGVGGLGTPVTAMATDPLGNSSEFGSCRDVDAAAIAVTNADDSGAGSLRSAILAANADPDEDHIVFAIPGWPHTITPATPLPTIQFPVVIDATTQPGYTGTPVIELSGAVSGGHGLTLEGNGNTIRGLAINRFLIGVRIDASDFNVIQRNHIGTDMTGTVDRGNWWAGISVVGNDNLIGGASSLDRNVISGNDDIGILFPGTDTTTENRVWGNYIGVAADGTTALMNGWIDEGGANGTGISILSGAVDNAIGGAGPGEGNVITGNPAGVYVGGAAATAIRGNYIGVSASGAAGAGNFLGVRVQNASPIILDNVISNGGDGVEIQATGGTVITGGMIRNNKIGVAADGVTDAGNNDVGLRLFTIGGEIADVRVISNTIAYNNGRGVVLEGDVTGVPIFSNSIHGNSLPGIDLGADGPDINDANDDDVGPNLRQNYPVITLASPETGVIEGSLSSTPFSTFRIQVFKSAVCGATRQGQTLLVDTVLTTDGSGMLTFSSGGLTFSVEDGITATATDENDNTSEFSACFEADAGSLTTLDFEDQLNEFAETDFPATYRGITWTGWKHKAPYSPIEVAPDGVNAVYAATGDARFTFATSFFLGAWFSVPILNPDLTNPPNDQLYLEVYYLGELVHTSAAITGATGGLVFLSAFYPGPADEVRVITTGVAMMTPAGSAWIMDKVEFDPGS